MARTELILKVDTKDIMHRMRDEMRVVFEAGWDAMRASMKAEVGADYAKREDLLEAAWLAFEAKVFDNGGA